MEEWKEYKLGEVVNILDYKRVPLSSKERSTRKGHYPYYGAQGIIDYIDDYIFDGTYLLIAEDGENLKSQKQNVAQLASGRYWVNNHAHIVESNGKSDIRYICYLLNMMDLSGYITGSAQPKLNQANLTSISLQLPSLGTQKRIADFLSVFDDKIEVNRRINDNFYFAFFEVMLIWALTTLRNDNLEQQAQALFKSWFVEFEPFRDLPFVESELGMIPEGWSATVLEELCSFISRGLTPKYDDSSDELILGQTCVRNNIVTLDNARKHKPKQKTEKWVQLWDTLINSTGVGSLGRVGIVYFDMNNVAIDSHITVARAKSALLRHYVGRNLLGRQFEIENMAVGSTGQTELPKDRVKSLPIVLPDDNALTSFNAIIEPIAYQLYRNIEESRRLAELRDTLLPRLMSGEIKVEDVTL